MAVYLICYGISYLMARQHGYMLSGLVLIAAALWLYWKDYRTSHDLIHLRGLFCLAFVGGQGVSCFKLSRLQTDWADETWLCLLLAVTAYWLAFELVDRRIQGAPGVTRPFRLSAKPQPDPSQPDPSQPDPFQSDPSQPSRRRILISMAAITGLSVAAFSFEAVRLGFIPMFSYGVPHAYSYFHISGVHYFTVSCVLVPSLFVVYLSRKGEGKPAWGPGLALTAVSLAVPLLCVSRFQLILAVGMATFTFISIQRTFRLKYLLVLAALMVPAYLALTVLRSHSVEYLNGIFQMKDSGTPIFITQPYIYIANNYDNFNCLVEQLKTHAMGLRMLFPLWALTGLKFLVPSLVSFPLYVTKEELTTVTLFYDAYYDFGVAGMVIFGCILGAACAWLSKIRLRGSNPAVHVIYAQIAMYMALAFFTTWFSNPATWFYLAATCAVYLYIGGFGGSLCKVFKKNKVY